MPEPYDNQIVRRNDHGVLAAGARHVVSVSGHGKSAIAVDPEKAAINRPAVGDPRRRQSADELDESLRQDSMPIPYAVLKVQVSQTRPVARAGKIIALSEQIPEGIGFDHHAAHAD